VPSDPHGVLSIFKAPRVVVAGGPLTGKTTLALRAGRQFGRQVRHSDALIKSHEWSEGSAEVARWLDEPGEWIIEGVATARALRKWLAGHPGQPLDWIALYLREPMQTRSRGQETLAKGVETVWREIVPELTARGVMVVDARL
jgi:dephospho-CoA kinase